MTDVAYPVVYAALLSLAQTALGSTVRVVDGYDVSQDPGDVLCLGIPDIKDENAISEGSYTQDFTSFGNTGTCQEDGSINGVVLSWNGDGDLSLARTTATGYVSALAAAIRTNRTLGISAFELKAHVASCDVLSDPADGSASGVSFVVAYKALL